MKTENNYKQILDLFVSKDLIREWMTKPFIIDDKIFSTNGHILVTFDKSNIDDLLDIPIADKKRIENIYPLENNLNKEISIKQLKDCFKSVKVVEGYDIVKKTEKCSECDIDGEVCFVYEDKTGQEYTKLMECPVCYGSGGLYSEIKTPNGKLTYDEKSICMIGKSYFYSKKIESIIKVAELLRVDSFKITYQEKENSSNLFSVGDVDLLIMPFFFNKNDIIDFKIKL